MGDYSYTTGAGTVVSGTTDTGNHCDDCATAVNLPFAYQLYDQSYTAAQVGSNGYVSFGTPFTSFGVTCLPNTVATYTIAPYWADQDTSTTSCPSCGIFTSVSGSAPNRIFNIEFRAVYWSRTGTPTLDYEVRLYEGQARFDLVYGLVTATAVNDSALAVGVERNPSSYTQVSCDPSGGTAPPVTTGQRLTFILGSCAIPTAGPSPTRPTGPSATPTAGVAASATPCNTQFSDVQQSDYFYTPVLYLACHGVISGYGDGTFRPYNQTTRSQMVKIVVLGFQTTLVTPPGGAYTFADVPPSFSFFGVIETAVAHNIVSGYLCGGPGEPCDLGNRPYFRPYANVTRGQLSKIDVVAARWPLLNPAIPTFADVPPNSPFYEFVETAACHGVISGYADHAFRPGNPAIRGQIAKIVYLSITGQTTCSRATGPGL